jgi:hypothetical protein
MANVVYKRLKEAAEAGNFCAAQVESATKEQFATQIGISAERIPDGIFVNAKVKLLRDMDREKWSAVLDGLKGQLVGGSRVWLSNNFPDVEFAVDHRRRTVTIFFEGKPEGDE